MKMLRDRSKTQRKKLQQYTGLKGRWGALKPGHSNLLKPDFSNFLFWKAEYSVDFSQIWYRHLVWVKCQGHTAIFIFVFFLHHFFAFLQNKMRSFTKTNIADVTLHNLLIWRSKVKIKRQFCEFLNF